MNRSDTAENFKVQLDLYSFIEDESRVIFCPSLDLYGYGKTLEDAEKAFAFTLTSFLDYTTQKQTLVPILKKLGWEISENDASEIRPPQMDKLLMDNEGFKDLLTNKEYRKKHKQVTIPALA